MPSEALRTFQFTVLPFCLKEANLYEEYAVDNIYDGIAKSLYLSFCWSNAAIFVCLYCSVRLTTWVG